MDILMDNMEAKELRIGNYIIEDGTIYISGLKMFERPLRLEDFRVDYDNWPDHWDMIVPIPLTEEWLLKLGFEYREFLDNFFIEIGEQGAIFIFENITAYLCETNSEKQFLCNLEHVHQLQNLYFALTGEELTTKQL